MMEWNARHELSRTASVVRSIEPSRYACGKVQQADAEHRPATKLSVCIRVCAGMNPDNDAATTAHSRSAATKRSCGEPGE
jgi:hypothetical protein